MSLVLSKVRKWLRSKPARACLLLGVFVSVLALAQLEALHSAIHADANEANHECAVTLLAAGKLLQTEGTVAVVLAEPSLMADVQPATDASGITLELLPPARAPPALLV